MNRAQFVQAGAAIIATLAETGSAPSGHVFTALQTADAQVYTLDAYQRVLQAITGAGFVRVSGHVLTLTTKGAAMAADMETK